MKLSQLLETFEFVPQPKLKKVKSFLTPELAQQHYELICQVLAKFVPSKELDVIQSIMLEKQVDSDTIEFYLKMLHKQLGAIDGVIMNPIQNGTVSGGLPSILDAEGRTRFGCVFWITYEKAKWQVKHVNFGSATKRFDEPKLIVPYLKKVFARFEKLRAEMKDSK